MIDIKLIRENKELVQENIKKRFQESKIELVEEVYQLDIEYRKTLEMIENHRADINKINKKISALFTTKQTTDEHGYTVEDYKQQKIGYEQVIKEAEETQGIKKQRIQEILLVIPNILDPEVPIGRNDQENVVLRTYLSPRSSDFEIPYHTDILKNIDGIDLDSARQVSGQGFYYLQKDGALLHTALLTFAREFMISKGFDYVLPPFLIRSQAVDGVMSFEERHNMMFKIEDEDLFLIGTSEHSVIAKFQDKILKYQKLPYKYTSYSPCFRKEKGAHGLEERGLYRVHQFEKQEMIVVCEPQESRQWFEKMYQYTAEFFTLLNIPVRALECCSGDLADLKVRSIDIEAYSPRQDKYFEVGSCSNLGDAQARRLAIRYDDQNRQRHFVHTLNNTVLASPRVLIAFLENNLNADGSINIPEPLQKYIFNKDKLFPVSHET